MNYELAVIGCGPAGMAAALSAWKNGLRKIIMIDREADTGGILNQCIHNGFGLHYFGEELTGPEYAGRFKTMTAATGIEARLDTVVLSLGAQAGPDAAHGISMVSPAHGYEEIQAAAVVLAMGCRERTRGSIAVPGSRPAGIFTAGAAQRYINIEGYMPGRRVVILGSGDIGLIMARRLTLEGAKVLACLELLPYSGGLKRNIVQCLDDFGIPLYLSHTVTNIEGRRRVERITAAKVGEDRRPIPGTEMYFDCDTLLLSVGLIPENELSRLAGVALDPVTRGPVVYGNMETSAPGIFACGNVVHVHDLVDFVSAEAEKAGKSAAEYVRATDGSCSASIGAAVNVRAGANVSYTVPQLVRSAKEAGEFFFRVKRPFGKSKIILSRGGKEIASFGRPFMAPGEMEKITVDPKALAAVFADGADAGRVLELNVEEA